MKGMTHGSAFVVAIIIIALILVFLSYFIYHNFTQIFFDIINFVRDYPLQAGIMFFIGLMIGLALGHPSY